MPCRRIDLGGGHSAIACSRGGRRRCSVAGCTRPGTQLCDYFLRTPKFGERPEAATCSKPVCTTHAKRLPGDRDYCPEHAGAAA